LVAVGCEVHSASLAMRGSFLVLLCVACAGRARRVQISIPDEALDRESVNFREFEIGSVVALILASLKSEAAFRPSGPLSHKPTRTISNRRMPVSLMSEEAKVAFDSFKEGDPSQGLAMRDDLVGTGDEAKEGDVVTIKYSGRGYGDDEAFDDGEITFKLGAGKVIPGWDQGVPGMKVGGKRTLRIPSKLAYGKKGYGSLIDPDEDLEFDCELVKTASGPVADFLVATGFGLNGYTLLVSLFFSTIIFPSFWIEILPKKIGP